LKTNTLQFRRTLGILGLFFYATTYGQQAVLPAGGSIQGSTGTVSYTVGQVSFTTNSNSSFSVAEGVQQPYEISVLDSDEAYDTIQLRIYPNPTSSYLLLEISALAITGLSYQVFDTTGKLVLLEQLLVAAQTQISLESLPSSTYYLEIRSSNKHLKTFKIIKN
jgi:hypothetical protein